MTPMSRSDPQELADRLRQGSNPQSKSELRLNRLDDRLHGASEGLYAKLAGDAPSSGFFAIKYQVSNFAENCRALLPVLDTLSKAHPAISVAVSVFKVGVELELARRENDGRVLALYTTMLEMMDTLRELDAVVAPQVGAAQQSTMEALLETRFDGPDGIVASVNTCVRTCDSYHKCRLPVRILTSAKWKQKFAGLADEFERHRLGLQMDLQVHTVHTHTNVSGRMEMMFERLRSPDEQALVAFVQNHGGTDAVAKDDELMARLLDMCSAKAEAKEATVLTLRDLQKQIRKGLERIISEDFSTFERKFMMMKEKIEETVGLVVHRETDRAIQALEAGHAGPHERILDRDVHQVWTDNRWRGSVTANRLVLALHDHFSLRVHPSPPYFPLAPRAPPSVTGPVTKTVTGDFAGDITRDAWALQYINVFRVQQLIEAIDGDVSSFITVDEVNAFTNARPPNWSLPHWIAYSTIGVELAVHWYHRRILRLLHQIDLDRRAILPTNRTAVDAFMDAPGRGLAERLLSGLNTSEVRDDVDWDCDVLFQRFRGYILRHERAMGATLRSASFNIGDESSLRLLAGGRQPEKYILPLICLLMQRTAVLVRAAWHTVLNENELSVIDTALCVVAQAVQYRINALEATYKLRNLDARTQIQAFFYGLYSNIKSPSTMGDFWERDASQLYFKEDAMFYTPQPHTLPVALFYGPSVEDVDFSPPESDTTSTASHASHTANRPADASLLGRWAGGYAYGPTTSMDSDESVVMDVDSQVNDGSFAAHGHDAIGAFAFRGRIQGARVTMRKSYATHSINYEGSTSDAGDHIAGRWGGAGWGGRFWLTRQAPEGVQTRPRSGRPRGLPKDSPSQFRISDSTSLVGHWWGIYTFGHANDARDDGPVSLDVSQHSPHGVLLGGGLDAVGTFTVTGRVDTRGRVVLRKAYESHAWNYTGTVGHDNDEISGTWGGRTFGGKFHLRRRPADYFLVRPAELDVAHGARRARLLWKWAMDTVIHRWRAKHLQTSYIRLLREHRDRYTEPVTRKDTVGRLPGEAESSWPSIVKMAKLPDLHFWRLRALFIARRQIRHRDAHCDVCGTSPIVGTRAVCVECSLAHAAVNSKFETVNFCWECFSEGRHQRFTGQRKHSATHHLVLLRTVTPARGVYTTHSRARKVLAAIGSAALDSRPGQSASESSHSGLIIHTDHLFTRSQKSMTDETLDWERISHAVRTLKMQDVYICTSCKRPTSRPFLICITCSLDIVCVRCNARVEVQRPWLSEHMPRSYPDPEGLHSWSHTLLLIPAPAQLSDALSTMDARLEGLESRLSGHLNGSASTYNLVIDMLNAQAAETAQVRAQLAAANQRMERMEALLLRLASGRGEVGR